MNVVRSNLHSLDRSTDWRSGRLKEYNTDSQTRVET